MRVPRGCTIFLTGLPGAGKTTLAQLLRQQLETLGRSVTLLDGDECRKHLSWELGFSRTDRDRNIRRIGYVASEVCRHGGMAICSAIAPYQAARQDARLLTQPLGAFILIYVSTPLDVCESRDTKGNYARARRGEVPSFTGISDPYEPPGDADLVINMARLSPGEGVGLILDLLRKRGAVE